ncbi:hypothetical protein MTO96_023651 [Rhipicephalus appendiculatus]
MAMPEVIAAVYIYLFYRFAVTLGLVQQAALLRPLGFRTTGVAPKTVASWLQSQHGGVVPRHGWFAALQKYGRKGGIPSVDKAAWKIIALILLYMY